MSRQPDAATRGFRPGARRRNRIAAGIALGAAAIGGNVLVYSSLDDTTTVVQAVDNIPAGTQVTTDMFRTVEVDVDGSVPTIGADQLPTLIGQYARVRIVSGQLVVGLAFQPEPLVDPGKAIVAIEVDADLVPTNVRDRSNLQLVVLDANEVPRTIPARAMEVPVESMSGNGSVSLSVEVDRAQSPAVAAAAIVRVVLLPPTADVDAGDPPTADQVPVDEPESAPGTTAADGGG
jgi:hypothetical protein